MPRNYPEFFAICKAAGVEYKEVVSEFTSGRTDSLRALNDGEYHELFIHVRKWQHTKRPDAVAPGDKQRKKLIALAGKMNWGNNTIEIVGRLNNWSLENYGVELNQLDVNTLNKVLWVMENKIYKDYLNKV